MKEEKIIELIEGLGKQIHRRDGDWIVEMNSVCYVDSQGIIDLISAAEQATLERAAKHFDKLNRAEWFAENVAEELRALKDSHE